MDGVGPGLPTTLRLYLSYTRLFSVSRLRCHVTRSWGHWHRRWQWIRSVYHQPPGPKLKVRPEITISAIGRRGHLSYRQKSYHSWPPLSDQQTSPTFSSGTYVKTLLEILTKKAPLC